MYILIFFLAHWYLSLFSQTFFLHRYAAHQMFTMSKSWEKFVYNSGFFIFESKGLRHHA
jgi:stearoyl-CoA desaturase (Delta-9 desaturase)